jgi:formylglycine-generating enzyme required for sulfatase activity
LTYLFCFVTKRAKLFLADFLTDEKRSLSEKGLIATVYGTLAADVPDAYARLEQQLAEQSHPDAAVEARIVLAKKQASIGAALLVMGRTEKVWPLLKHQSDPTLRSFLIEWLGPVGVGAKLLLAQLKCEKEDSIKRAILLCLGEYGLDRLTLAERESYLPHLLELYRDATDPGTHGTAEWLLRQWGTQEKIKEIDNSLSTGKVEGQRQWYINRQGQLMVIIHGPMEYPMGTRPFELVGRPPKVAGKNWDMEALHPQRIVRSFAISSKEVTTQEFLRFRIHHEYRKETSPSSDCPANEVSWFDAAEYCNWLSKQDGLPEEEWCYLPSTTGKFESGMQMAPAYLQRTGYRLPTEAEWEFACRAESETSWSHGQSRELLMKYAWFDGNSFGRNQVVGMLRPNDFGLFDMHGNVYEWCQNLRKEYQYGKLEIDAADTAEVIETKLMGGIQERIDFYRTLRGGSFEHVALEVRSASRTWNLPHAQNPEGGFRPVRTVNP